MHVLVASPHDDLLDTLDEQIGSGDEFHIGERPFTVAEVCLFGVDVGEPTHSVHISG
jgi:hypothetical protein